jgi:hypothetical protein
MTRFALLVLLAACPKRHALAAAPGACTPGVADVPFDQLDVEQRRVHESSA